MSLKVALKAPQLGYAAIVAANFVAPSQTISVEYVDDKAVDGGNVSYESTTDAAAATLAIAAAHPLVIPTPEGTGEWIEFATKNLTLKAFPQLMPQLAALDAHLDLHLYMLGYAVLAADIVAWATLRGNGVAAGAIKLAQFANVTRWFTFLEQDARFLLSVDQMIKGGAEAKKAGGAKKTAHKANFDIKLPDAEMGKVVTRFPPEPSGYLHIGHAKAAVLNQYFANMYKGKLIIRFDDTNPLKEKAEFEELIIEDLKLLGVHGDVTTYSSDHFDTMYEYAVKMIKEGLAYADDTGVDQMREERGEGIKLARRDRSVEENLRIFTEEMKQGTEEGLKNCIRAKIDFQAPNKALRDPVIYRCNLTPHHRTGTTWKMYPTYDFCMPLVDALEGVTHALRTNEYRDRNPQYEWMQQALKVRKVHIWDFARVNFIRTLLSKRKLQWFVDEGLVSNWDDPRFPTVRGVRRRGMTVEGLRNFIVSQGPSRNIINLDWLLIWAVNKKVIDPVAPRHTCLTFDEQSPLVKVHLAHGPQGVVLEQRPKHKKNPDVGNKTVLFASDALIEQADAATFEEGEEVTFMDWGNVIVNKIHKTGDVVTSIDGTLNLEGDFRKTKHKVTWLADTKDVVPVEMVDFDHLITKDKLEEGDNFMDFLTKQTEFHTHGLADVNVKQMKEGDVIQFERKGYFRLDKTGKDIEPVFFTIPDGKTVNKYGAKA